MKAVRIHSYGGPEVLKLEDIEIPKPSANEVLIKVYASSVNPVDQKIFSGEAQDRFPNSFPLTVGWDVSGVVEEVGVGVKQFRIGEEVFGRPMPSKNGAFAEYILVPENQLALKPKSLDHISAASVPLAGLTAWQGLFERGKLEKGQKVLIHGASGGVGSFAVQFAKWKGAEVTGTSSADNMSFVKQLGADEAVDYNQEFYMEQFTDFDLVLDLIGGNTQRESISVLKAGGRIVTTVAPEFQEEAKAEGIYLESFMAQSKPADLKQIADLIDEGKISPVVSSIFNLEDAQRAEILNQNGHQRGKIVVKVV